MWAALLGGLIGAGIPGFLTYMGLRRARQSNDAQAFGPALLLLHRLEPYRVMMNVSRDLEVEAAKWTDMPQKIEAARERLLVVSAGNPRHRVRELAFAAQVKLGNVHHAMGWQLSDMLTHKDNLEWVDIYRKAHAEAETTMRELIDANFAWGYLPKRWVALARRDDQGGNETAPAVTTSPPGEGRRPQHRQVAGSADGLRSRFGRRRGADSWPTTISRRSARTGHRDRI
jgi:hypothetical protein